MPPTKPFFNDGTWVDDYFAGELYYAILKAAKYDVIFLMLYAPWDADSQNARSEFETVCRYFHKKVNLAMYYWYSFLSYTRAIKCHYAILISGILCRCELLASEWRL